MGGEFGQWNEWSERRELDWSLLEFPAHRGIHDLVRDLNILLRSEPAMHRYDHSWRGFSWLDCSDSDASVYSFARTAEDCPPVIWIFNCTPIVREGYSIPCPAEGLWQERLNTDWSRYGGSNVENPGVLRTEYTQWGQGRPTLRLTLPPLAAVAFLPADHFR
jgi:1,4-alpha-glucan branching enzyme